MVLGPDWLFVTRASAGTEDKRFLFYLRFHLHFSLTWKKVCDVHSSNWLVGMGVGEAEAQSLPAWLLHSTSLGNSPGRYPSENICSWLPVPGTMKSTPPKWNYSISPHESTAGPYTKAYDLKVTNLDLWVVDIRM